MPIGEKVQYTNPNEIALALGQQSGAIMGSRIVVAFEESKCAKQVKQYGPGQLATLFQKIEQTLSQQGNFVN